MTNQQASREQSLAMYAMIARIRACDEAIRNGIARGQLIFFYFPVAGHEAIPAALSQVITRDDYLVATYRGFHHQLAKGIGFERILGEMTGKSTAIHGGRSGAMHICDPAVGLMMTTGIVGATVPPAAGMAWASKIRKDRRVTICIFGDGAINQGAVHEGMNLAAAWQLPVVFVCENNRFAETTPTHLTYRGTITGRAEAYGIPAQTVDGYDPVALFSALSVATERARSGGGPTLIDALCFRYYGHYFGDPMITVPREQLESEMRKDPLKTFAEHLVASGGSTAEALAAIRSTAETEARAVVEANIAAPAVSGEGLLEGAYANPFPRAAS